jgi:hypothetical protein
MKKIILLVVFMFFLKNNLQAQYASYTISNSTLQNGSYNIIDASVPPSLIAGFYGALPSAIANVNPRNRAGDNAPYYGYGGQNSSHTLDAPFRVSIGNTGTGLGETAYYSSNGQHTSFTIKITYRDVFTVGASPNKYDIKAVLMHELCHGVGLDHNSQHGLLMSVYATPNKAYNTISNNEITAFNYIYNSATGNSTFHVKKDKNLVTWNLENYDSTTGLILGFNIYKKNLNDELVNVNKTLILVDKKTNDYQYLIDTTTINEDYYIEIVKEEMFNNRMLKI